MSNPTSKQVVGLARQLFPTCIRVDLRRIEQRYWWATPDTDDASYEGLYELSVSFRDRNYIEVFGETLHEVCQKLRKEK
jgi:hypothetical protein